MTRWRGGNIRRCIFTTSNSFLMMMSLLSRLYFLASTISLLRITIGLVDDNPGCFDSCSKEINCTISRYSYGFCGAGTHSNFSQGPDIAAEPVGLSVRKYRDDDHQYVNMSWHPPQDGSYNYLSGFLVQVTVINLDPVHAGLTGTICYSVIPGSNWFQTHRSLHQQGGVSFFMNCLRLPAQASMDLVISIHSLPLKHNSPKLAKTSISIEPDVAFWNPKFDKWADSDDVMHLVIQNPLKEARYYAVQIKSVDKGKKVFDHIFHACPTNQTQDEYTVLNNDGLPHFLITGLNKEDNYSILMDVLDGNKTRLQHMRSIQTNPFKLNFTIVTLASSNPTNQGLDNRLIIIISVVMVVVISILVCLIWKGVIGPNKLRKLVGNCVMKMNGINSPTAISFLPIYCHENDSFVGAVENHVTLLRRCLETYCAQNSLQDGLPYCCSSVNDQLVVDIQNKDCEIIIYLSPRLGEILKLGYTSPSQCSRLDVLCHQALMSLYERRQNGQGVIPLLVSFDCFEQAELLYINDLIALIAPPDLGAGHELSTPVKLAYFNSNCWKIENIELLIARLNHHPNFSQNTHIICQGWREYEETKAVERYLFHLAESKPGISEQISMPWHLRTYSGPENSDCVHYSNCLRCSREELARSFSDCLDKNPDDCDVDCSREDTTFLPKSPFSFRASGFQTSLEPHVSENLANHGLLASNYLPSPAPCYTVELQPIVTGSKDKSNLQSSNSCSPTPSWRLRMQDCHETLNSSMILGGQHREGVVTYKPNIYERNLQSGDAHSVNSVESDSLLRTNDLNGYLKFRDQFLNEALEETEYHIHKRGLNVPGGKNIIVPPSLIDSNFTSMESVCERINRVNDRSGWSELNMSK